MRHVQKTKRRQSRNLLTEPPTPKIISEPSTFNFEPTDKVLILGRSGCGKSYLARELQKMWPRKVIFDTLGEYAGEGEAFFDFESLAQRLILAQKKSESEFKLVFQFDPEAQDADLIFNELMRIIYYTGNILIVIEEVQLFSSPHFIPHWVKNSLLTGRHQGIGMLFTTQRPGELNKTVVSQSGHIFCGNLIDRNDINYVSNFLNQHASKLLELKSREFIYRNQNKNLIIKISTDGMAQNRS